jgi:hypothetical protein
VELAGTSLCNTPACPALAIDMVPPHAPYIPREPYAPDVPMDPYDDAPIAPPIHRRGYATPPPGVL